MHTSFDHCKATRPGFWYTRMLHVPLASQGPFSSICLQRVGQERTWPPCFWGNFGTWWIYRGKVFSKIALSQVYLQVPLAVESCQYIQLTVINTHKGFFRCSKLSLGVSSAPRIFQKVMETLLQRLTPVIMYIDDIPGGWFSRRRVSQETWWHPVYIHQGDMDALINYTVGKKGRHDFLGQLVGEGHILLNWGKVFVKLHFS